MGQDEFCGRCNGMMMKCPSCGIAEEMGVSCVDCNGTGVVCSQCGFNGDEKYFPNK